MTVRPSSKGKRGDLCGDRNVGLEAWLAGLREEPSSVRQVLIPKPNRGGERPRGIPTVCDRAVQTAGKPVLEPIFYVREIDLVG